MNKVALIGRLTKDPEVKYNGEMAIAKYTVAVDRKFKKGEADFINIVAFSKQGEFAEKYLKKGMKIAIAGHIQTGSYTARDGSARYTFDVVADEHEFVEKKAQSAPQSVQQPEWSQATQEELPFV